jgi:hypothetical protein
VYFSLKLRLNRANDWLSERRLEQMHEQERFNVTEFQDRLSKNLSNELVKSTGRVFEAALKTEVQRTILPALEVMTKNEVRQALDSQIVRGIGESMNHVCTDSFFFAPFANRYLSRLFPMKLSACSSDLTSLITLPAPSLLQ